MNKLYLFILILFILQACSNTGPDTKFKYKGSSYKLNEFEMVRLQHIMPDGMEVVIEFSGYGNGQKRVDEILKADNINSLKLQDFKEE
jgi:hypothetical protein